MLSSPWLDAGHRKRWTALRETPAARGEAHQPSDHRATGGRGRIDQQLAFLVQQIDTRIDELARTKANSVPCSIEASISLIEQDGHSE